MSQESFFQFREKITRAGRKSTGGADTPPDGRNALSVSELTARIEAALRGALPAFLRVRGEVSNLNHHRASGHLYFTLKDQQALIDCVMFRSDAATLRFTPTDGMELLAGGSVRVYPQRGRYQLYVSSLTPLGQGALELALKQLREKLGREGLFDADRKRPLPAFPLRICIITGRDTAALQDILKVFAAFPFLRPRLLAVPVQGDGAANRIAAAIDAVSADDADVILLARGGGSLEDLWAFNGEIVARAVAASAVPVVTGIGHEIDVSIADLVADYHAHTPTEAAQVLVSAWRTAPTDLTALAARLTRCVRQRLSEESQRLTAVARHEFFRRPMDLVEQRLQWLDDRQRNLVDALSRRAVVARGSLEQAQVRLMRHHPGHAVRLASERLRHATKRLVGVVMASLTTRERALSAIDRELRAVSPVGTLNRGYSITSRKSDGSIVRSSEELRPNDVLLTRFADGEAESVVRDPRQLRLFE